MQTAEAGSAAVVPRHERREAADRATESGLFQCLVLGTSRTRRHFLAVAAEDEGWHTIACRSIRHARVALQRHLLKLALVDVQGRADRTKGEFGQLIGELASVPKLLLVICGNEEDPLEEIWARQMGSWLYLPGVTGGSDVGMVCREAMVVARKLDRGDAPLATSTR